MVRVYCRWAIVSNVIKFCSLSIKFFEPVKVKFLILYLERKKITRMADLKAALNTNVNMTIFRKLNDLSYYTLEKNIKFDAQGLWGYKGLFFSKYGTLQSTTKAFVEKSEAGYAVNEISEMLHEEVKKSLLTLYRNNQFYRDKISGIYIYFSNNKQIQQQQIIICNRNQLG